MQELKKNATKYILALILVAAFVYMILQISLGKSDAVETEHTTYMSYVETETLQGYIFRNEKPLFSSVAGTNCYLVGNGERVAKGAAVAITYTSESDASVQERISKIESMIRLLELSQITQGTSTTDLSIMDENIKKMTVDILQEVANDNLAKAIRSEESLWIQLNRRQALLNADTISYGTRINQLKQEKESLEDTLSGDAVRVYTTEPGYFYTKVDGYEEAFSIEALNSLSVNGFQELINSDADRHILQDACGKLVNTSAWYLAVPVSKRTAGAYQNGKSYEVVFPYSGSITLKMELSKKVSHTDNDTVILVFQSRNLPEDFDFTRSQAVQLVTGSYSGIRVSSKGLRMLDGEVGCYVLDGNIVTFKKAEILYRTDEYAICEVPYNEVTKNRDNHALISEEYLSLYDTVILNANDLYVGKMIQ